MWLTPWRSSRASTSSARAWPMEARPAAPKMTRLLSWPVRPNGAVGIMRCLLRWRGTDDPGRDGDRRPPPRDAPLGCSPVGDEGIRRISARHPSRLGLAVAVLVAVVAGLGACADDDADGSGLAGAGAADAETETDTGTPASSEDAAWVRPGHAPGQTRGIARGAAPDPH